jgi:hypothetical protein
MSSVTVAAAPSSRRWLFGPMTDLLFGCGVGYALVFALQVLNPDLLRSWIPIGAAPLVILLSGTPHYGATLLRVYERAEDRRAYRFFTLWVTVAVVLAFFAGLGSVVIGSWLLTLYLTWSPWHYSGQNYGVAMMFLRRRGIEVTPQAKRFFHASFFLCFLLTFLAQHGKGASASYAPFASGGDQIRFIPLGLPSLLTETGLLVVGVAYAVVLVYAFGSFLRRGSVRDVLPAAVLTFTQALWFAVPVIARNLNLFTKLEPISPQNADYAFLWIAAGHSIQYLWVTTFYVAGNAWRGERARFLGKSLLAGAAVWNVPLLLLGPAVFGVSRSDAGLSALIASAVNLHHFILDGAIWKLRDGRVAKILIRERQATRTPAPSAALGTAPATQAGVPWFRMLAFAAGVVCVGFILLRTYEKEIGFRDSLRRGDLARAQVATQRLAFVGLDTPDLRLALGRAAEQLDRPAVAAEQLQRSLGMRPDPAVFTELGLVYENAGRFQEATQAYASALALAPDDVAALHRAGVTYLAMGQAERARELLERAVALAPEEKLIAMNLTRARARIARDANGGEAQAPAATPRATPADPSYGP